MDGSLNLRHPLSFDYIGDSCIFYNLHIYFIIHYFRNIYLEVDNNFVKMDFQFIGK